MYKKLRTTVLLAFCLLSAHSATADDAVWGALLGAARVPPWVARLVAATAQSLVVH